MYQAARHPRTLAARLAPPVGVLLAALLGACGGGGDGGTPPPDPPSSNQFTQTATWTFALPAANASICYDYDTQAVVADCSGTAWDLKVSSGGRTATLWTNSGTSGSGGGGAFGGPFDHTWTELSAWQNATTDPISGAIPQNLFFKDSASGVFAGTNDIQSAAFEYALAGETDHKLYPTYRTFVITTDTSKADVASTASTQVFTLQVIGYYGGASGTTSGFPSFRWADTAAPGTVRTATVDATADWVYYDLVNGAEVPSTGTWHIAFNRNNVMLNGGASGSGTVGGYLGKTPAGLYNADGQPIASAFLAATPASTLADLTAADMALPAAAADWIKDGQTSALTVAYQGTYPSPLNYGWFTYYPSATAASAAGLSATAHLLAANPESASMLRGGEGTSYSRFHVTGISYADPANASSQQTWTIVFDVQPAQ